jgi:hypothetical protein
MRTECVHGSALAANSQMATGAVDDTATEKENCDTRITSAAAEQISADVQQISIDQGIKKNAKGVQRRGVPYGHLCDPMRAP